MSRRTLFSGIAGCAALFLLLSASFPAGCAAAAKASSQPLEAAISQGIARLGYLWPLFVQGKITSRYGQRTHPVTREADYHMGVDIQVPRGASIRAARAGTVLFSGPRGGYGNAVIIKHDEKNSSLYGHCDRLFVKRDQTVHQGQVIALAGDTGRTTGPHLHFEIRTGRGAVNPLGFWKQHTETSGP